MQIVIPMSGFGERFRRAGYTVPKPLIEIERKPVISHVIDMFPGETNFILSVIKNILMNRLITCGRFCSIIAQLEKL